MNKKKRKNKQKTSQKRQREQVETPRNSKEGVENHRNTPQEEKPCLWTMTGEIFQPVRLYYKKVRRSEVVDAFLHLSCMEFIPAQERWVWISEAEAANFAPKEGATILGSVYFSGKNVMYIDLFSYQRAIAAIMFFNRHLPKKAAKASHIGMINRLFGEREEQSFMADDYFRKDAYFKDESLAITAKLIWLTLRTRNMQKRMALLDEFMKNRLNSSDPEVEYFKVRSNKEGIEQLTFMLSSRQKVAIQRWQGNTDYTQEDLFKEFALKLHKEGLIQADEE